MRVRDCEMLSLKMKSIAAGRRNGSSRMSRIVAFIILFMIQEAEKISTLKILADALHLELNEIRNSLLLLFSFVYDKDKMMKARSAFSMKKREGIANALEIIEIEVPKEISLKFNKIFEPGTIGDKCNAMKVYFKEQLTYEKIIDDILQMQQLLDNHKLGDILLLK